MSKDLAGLASKSRLTLGDSGCTLATRSVCEADQGEVGHMADGTAPQVDRRHALLRLQEEARRLAMAVDRLQMTLAAALEMELTEEDGCMPLSAWREYAAEMQHNPVHPIEPGDCETGCPQCRADVPRPHELCESCAAGDGR